MLNYKDIVSYLKNSLDSVQIKQNNINLKDIYSINFGKYNTIYVPKFLKILIIYNGINILSSSISNRHVPSKDTSIIQNINNSISNSVNNL